MNKGYIFKVSLKHIRPPIWRRIWVPQWLSLNEFHQVIQDVMGWYDCHLHSFETGGKEYGIPDEDFPESTIDDTEVALKKVVRKVGQKIRYIYDFGDYWEHEIVLEKKESSDSIYPYVLKGKRACPPEDCGSVSGYCQILEVLDKTNHSKDEEELLEWLGSSYDPESFDIDEVNELLKIGQGDRSDGDR